MQSKKMSQAFNAIEHISFGVTLIEITLESTVGRVKIMHLRNEPSLEKKKSINGSLRHSIKTVAIFNLVKNYGVQKNPLCDAIFFLSMMQQYFLHIKTIVPQK